MRDKREGESESLVPRQVNKKAQSRNVSIPAKPTAILSFAFPYKKKTLCSSPFLHPVPSPRMKRVRSVEPKKIVIFLYNLSTSVHFFFIFFKQKRNISRIRRNVNSKRNDNSYKQTSTEFRN